MASSIPVPVRAHSRSDADHLRSTPDANDSLPFWRGSNGVSNDRVKIFTTRFRCDAVFHLNFPGFGYKRRRYRTFTVSMCQCVNENLVSVQEWLQCEWDWVCMNKYIRSVERRPLSIQPLIHHPSVNEARPVFSYSLFLSIHLFYSSIKPSIWLYIHPSINLPIYSSINPSAKQSIHSFFHSSI